jgi:glycosyltransferase involved in cell wall biosynthesis
MSHIPARPPRVLFITYDGMTDPLGQSQVLPYLEGLARRGYEVTLLSTEKPARLVAHRATIEAIVAAAGIRWEFILFTSRPPILAKIYDQYRLQRAALRLHAARPFDLVHCRSYVAAGIGQVLRQRFGVKFLFDMRGFWVDERVEGGIWNINQPFYKALYRRYKHKEAEFIAQADGIVSLTEAGAAEIRTWPAYRQAPIVVIPCSADFEAFHPIPPERRNQVRAQLGLAPEALVVSYLGSLGTWYLLPDMLHQFAVIKQYQPGARMLFITQDDAAVIQQAATEAGLSPEDVLVRPAQRQEVTELVGASDVNLFFIRPSYSKKASSPTKLGEVLAIGLPVICNDGVGDVGSIIRQTEGGIALSELTESEFNRAAQALPELLSQDSALRRSRARQYYDLSNAVASYARQYATVLGTTGSETTPPMAAAHSS